MGIYAYIFIYIYSVYVAFTAYISRFVFRYILYLTKNKKRSSYAMHFPFWNIS